jgi:hypothetical protein
MPIAPNSSGLFQWNDSPFRKPALGIDSARLDETVSHYHENSYRGLFGHKSFGFAQFPSLQTLVNYWGNPDSLLQSSIVKYHLWHCKPRSKSFEGVEVPLCVKKLELNWANPESLVGLPQLNQLKELDIYRCRNLHDLSALPEIAPNLERVAVQTCSRVEPTGGVANHPSLRHACINGTIVRMQSG